MECDPSGQLIKVRAGAMHTRLAVNGMEQLLRANSGKTWDSAKGEMVTMRFAIMQEV